MNRRQFLSRLVTGAAAVTAVSLIDLEGFVADPEKLLWIPGQKTFFLPPTEAFISGADAVKDFRMIEQRPVQDVLTGAIRHVQTRRGILTFDAAWNIIGHNGRRIDAAEATQLRQESFAPWGGRWKDPNVHVTEPQVVAARAGAGVTEPKKRESYFTVDPRTVTNSTVGAPFRIIDDESPPWRPGEEPWTARGRAKAGALKPHNPRGGSRLIKSEDW